MIEKPNVELADNQFYLPVGLQTENGIVRLVTLKPMRGETEEAIGDSKVSQNAGKIITELLFGVIDSIEGITKVTKDHVRSLSVADRDFLMAMNYVVSFGDELDFKHKCINQNCKVDNNIHVKVPELAVKYLDDSDSLTHTVTLHEGASDKGVSYPTIEFRYPTGADQESVIPLLKTNPGQANTVLLQRITNEFRNNQGGVFKQFTPAVFKNMLKRDRNKINEYLKEHTPGVDLEVIYSCVGCGNENTTSIPALAFLSM